MDVLPVLSLRSVSGRAALVDFHTDAPRMDVFVIKLWLARALERSELTYDTNTPQNSPVTWFMY